MTDRQLLKKFLQKIVLSKIPTSFYDVCRPFCPQPEGHFMVRDNGCEGCILENRTSIIKAIRDNYDILNGLSKKQRLWAIKTIVNQNELPRIVIPSFDISSSPKISYRDVSTRLYPIFERAKKRRSLTEILIF